MRRPPEGNVPIDITEYLDRIEVSGRLSKPEGKGNIGHDPNIGALSMIAKTLRVLGYEKDIVITKHGVSQSYIDRTRGKNKFLYICATLNIKLKGIIMPPPASMPNSYWHYEMKSEKVTSILLHLMGLVHGMHTVYENHAGSERGYFKDKEGKTIALPKKDKDDKKLYLPDLVLYDEHSNCVILVEGKKLSTLQDGIKEIKHYDSIENEFIRPAYSEAKILRYVSVFGGTKREYLHNDVLIYMNIHGEIFINPHAPECIKKMFRAVGVKI